MKRWITLLCAFAVFASVLLAACENTPDSASLYQHGLSLIPYMKQTALYPEAFFSSTDDYVDAFSALAEEDHSEPTAVYELSFSQSLLFQQLDITLPGSVPEQYEDYMLLRAYKSIPSYINTKSELDDVIVSSLCTASRTFVSEERSTHTVYVYSFENATPVMVVFTIGDDHTVTADGQFLLYDECNTESEESIEESLALLGAEATKITS